MAVKAQIKAGEVQVEVAVAGDYTSTTTWAILDSGFNGDIVIDINRAMRLGLQPAGAGGVTLADGSTTDVPLFTGYVRIGDETPKEAIFIIAGDELLLGMNLMKDYSICFNASKNEATVKAKMAVGEAETISVSRVYGASPLDTLRTTLKAISPQAR